MNKQIRWQDSAPYNAQYEDIYFSPSAGLAESKHVFLDGNMLEQRWAKLREGDVFTVFEAGFGSGLNFLATWRLWQASANATLNQCALRYVSCELNPFNKIQYQQAFKPFEPELSEQIESFLSTAPEPVSGVNIFKFSPNIELHYIKSDISKCQSFISNTTYFDAIYLDGFSPAKNPDMWSDELIHWLYQQANPAATLATFSVAGHVKRKLVAAGFEIKKVPGFGKKREMLTAYKAAT